MPKKKKAAKAAAPKKARAAKPKTKKAAKLKGKNALKAKAEKGLKPKVKKALKAAKTLKPKAKKPKLKKAAKVILPVVEETAELLSTETVFEGPLFHVDRDKLVEPGGRQVTRDIVRHNGSVVILAVDNSKNKRDPWVVVERQYRHAAGRFLWELPAGKLEPGEDAMLGAQRELKEETGYWARKWTPLVEYYASPGFLCESMEIFLAEGLIAGEAHPESDERIEPRLVKLSELAKLAEKGAILDGKTMIGVLLYARRIAGKRGR